MKTIVDCVTWHNRRARRNEGGWPAITERPEEMKERPGHKAVQAVIVMNEARRLKDEERVCPKAEGCGIAVAEGT